jgi:hypothetical protein
MPKRTLSPLAFSSTASSKTTFRNTFHPGQRDPNAEETSQLRGTYIVASKNTDHFAVAVELYKQPLFHILQNLLAGIDQRVHRIVYLLELWLCLRHLEASLKL